MIKEILISRGSDMRQLISKVESRFCGDPDWSNWYSTSFDLGSEPYGSWKKDCLEYATNNEPNPGGDVMYSKLCLLFYSFEQESNHYENFDEIIKFIKEL